MNKCLLTKIILLSILCGCGEKKMINAHLQSLEGTKWKLAGIVDESGSLQVLEHKDCKDCYTITFDTDSSFYSNSASNAIWGSYKINYKTGDILIHCGLMTEVVAIGDESLYVKTLNKAQSFSLKK